MDFNNTAILIGYPSKAPVTHQKDDKLFVAFGLATQESYLDGQGAWQKRKPVFHDILVSGADLIETAQALSTKDRIKVTGQLFYQYVEAKNAKGGDIKIKKATKAAGKIEPAPLPSKE